MSLITADTATYAAKSRWHRRRHAGRFP